MACFDGYVRFHANRRWAMLHVFGIVMQLTFVRYNKTICYLIPKLSGSLHRKIKTVSASGYFVRV